MTISERIIHIISEAISKEEAPMLGAWIKFFETTFGRSSSSHIRQGLSEFIWNFVNNTVYSGQFNYVKTVDVIDDLEGTHNVILTREELDLLSVALQKTFEFYHRRESYIPSKTFEKIQTLMYQISPKNQRKNRKYASNKIINSWFEFIKSRDSSREQHKLYLFIIEVITTIAHENDRSKYSKLDIEDVLQKYRVRIKSSNTLLRRAITVTYANSKYVRRHLRDILDDINYIISASPDFPPDSDYETPRSNNNNFRRSVDLRTGMSQEQKRSGHGYIKGIRDGKRTRIRSEILPSDKVVNKIITDLINKRR